MEWLSFMSFSVKEVNLRFSHLFSRSKQLFKEEENAVGEICSLTHRALSWSFDLEGFIHYLACLSQATFCMSLYVINVQSSQQLIHVTMQRCWEKRESKKVFRFSLQGLSGFFFLCTIMKFCGSDLYSCFCCILGFLEDLENLGQIY